MLLKQKLKTWQKRAHIRREERERGVSDLSYVIYLKGRKTGDDVQWQQQKHSEEERKRVPSELRELR